MLLEKQILFGRLQQGYTSSADAADLCRDWKITRQRCSCQPSCPRLPQPSPGLDELKQAFEAINEKPWMRGLDPNSPSSQMNRWSATNFAVQQIVALAQQYCGTCKFGGVSD